MNLTEKLTEVSSVSLNGNNLLKDVKSFEWVTVPAEQRRVAQAEFSNLSEASPKHAKIVRWLQVKCQSTDHYTIQKLLSEGVDFNKLYHIIQAPISPILHYPRLR